MALNKHSNLKPHEKARSPVLIKNVLVPENEETDWVFNQQSFVFPCSNSDVEFPFVKHQMSSASPDLSTNAVNVTMKQLHDISPNQKVNDHATLTMRSNEPRSIESLPELLVKEDCILEDNRNY